MSPRFVLGRENVPCVAEVVNRSLKADCTDFTQLLRDIFEHWVTILSYFQVGKGRGDHSVSIFHVSLSGYNEKSFKLLSSNYWKT